MKAFRIAIAAVSVAIAFSSCENFNDDFSTGFREVIIHASVADQPQETKSAIDEFGDVVTYTWLAGDAISVFFGDSEGSIFVTDATAPKAQFKGTVGAVTGGGADLNEETSLWGVYPYDRNNTCDGSSVTFTLPHVQGAAPDTFADDLFPSVARSTNFVMAFHPVCGSIRVKVSSPDIVKITLRGNSNEDLAGTAKVSMPLDGAPSVESVSNGQKELVINAPDGGSFDTSKYYYFVLYPQTLSRGLTITYYKEDEKASYVLNSSLKVGQNSFLSATNKDSGLTFTEIQGGEIGGEDAVKVQTIYMLSESAVLAPGTSYSLDTDYEPYNATNTVWSWKSSDASVAYVDGNGKVTAVSDGEAVITATATDGSGANASCSVTVKAVTAVADMEYKDEYGVNHGRGIAIGYTVWAPVNCGYHKTDYPYGKLYQWGRKYGQGYSEEYDATVPEIVKGPVKISLASDPSNSNVFYYNNTSPYDWALYPNDALWNSGTEESPIKNKDNDPCPDGWRVPTYKELSYLIDNYSSWTSNSTEQNGYYFSGEYTYLEDAPQIFLPAAGGRYYDDGDAYLRGYYGYYGYYWSSRPGNSDAYHLDFYSSDVGMRSSYRAFGFSVRCVQGDLYIPASSVTLSSTSLKLYEGNKAVLTANVSPTDATYSKVTWSSDAPEVAYVNQNGEITAISDGEATITATATDGSGTSASCSVVVKAVTAVEYKDEYGVNHGKGVAIGSAIWAPVNCGYHKTDYPYGKLYQWGRKYGQGYSGPLYDDYGDIIGTISDATYPSEEDGTIKNGGVYLGEGQSNSNKDVFFIGHSDWIYPYGNNKLWNSGTEESPKKNKDNDPCPEGWRVPTYNELDELNDNHSSWTQNDKGQNGRWFSGASTYVDYVPQIFLPAAGFRFYVGGADGRGDYGLYWSSRPIPINDYPSLPWQQPQQRQCQHEQQLPRGRVLSPLRPGIEIHEQQEFMIIVKPLGQIV